MSTVKTIGEFVRLVKSMRMHQKEYFKTKDPDMLQRSKQLEKEVDEAIHHREQRHLSKQ